MKKFISKIITMGNLKMTIPNFALPAMLTCPGAIELCIRYCYAKKAERLYPAVVVKRKANLELSKQENFVDIMIAEINQLPLMPYFRIHESGDFYNQEYLNKWYEIIKAFPKKKFLAFTKSFNLDFSGKPKNLNIYFSIWNDTKLNLIQGKRFNKAYTVMVHKNYTGKNIEIEKSTQCKGYCDSCLYCFENKGNVFFNSH